MSEETSCNCVFLCLLGLFLLILLIYYLKSKRDAHYWTKRGVKSLEPRFILGNFVLPPTKNMADRIIEWYQHFPEERYHGLFLFSQKSLMIKDADLIKDICVKEFDSFPNHRFFIPAGIDPVWDKNLIILKDNKWKEMRSILSPSFTSSKMKSMFILMEEVAVQVVDYLKTLQSDEKPITEVVLKDVTTRYTNDVIATTAFGLKVDSFKDQNNEFYKTGQNISNFSGFRSIKVFLAAINPALCKLLGIKVLPKHPVEYLNSIIRKTVETRKSEKIRRPDMIDILMEQMEKENSITMEDVLAQSLIFFLAGFESAATTLSFLFHELTINPDVQTKLRQEINKLETINYETVLNLKYLDMVVSETLRKWPAGISTDREVSKKFTIQPVRPDEKPLELYPGDLITLPMMAIQRDPKYFEDPKRFDPERFSEENKSKIVPYSYFPFGAGPRVCIGSRFALMEIKLLTVHLVKNFEFVPVAKTRIPMVLDKWGMQLTPKDGIIVGFKKL